MPATRVTVESSPVLLSSSVGLCVNAASAPQGTALVTRLPDAGAGPVRPARHPYRLTAARAGSTERRARAPHRRPRAPRPAHRAGRAPAPARLRRRPRRGDAVRAARRRAARASIEVRARGSLERALGDRIEVRRRHGRAPRRVDARSPTSPTGCVRPDDAARAWRWRLTADAELLQPACPPLGTAAASCFDPAPACTACAAPRRGSTGAQRVARRLAVPGAARRARRRRRSGGSSPPPGGAPVAIAAAAPVAAPAPHVELDARPGCRTRRATGCRSTRRPRCPFDPLRTLAAGPAAARVPGPRQLLRRRRAAAAARRRRPCTTTSPATGARCGARCSSTSLREDPDADLSIADPDDRADRAVRARRRRAALPARPRRHRGLPRDGARCAPRCSRHARLVDFALSDGVAARARASTSSVAPEAAPVTVQAGDVAVDAPGSRLAFTLEADLHRATPRSARSRSTTGARRRAACRPGATECVLVRPQPADPLGDAWLAPGDLLAFEVVDPDDAARHQRWARAARRPGRPTPAATPASASRCRAAPRRWWS